MYDQFVKHTITQLIAALDEIKWWRDRVATGLVTEQFADSYIAIERKIVRTKLSLLGATLATTA